MSHAPVCLNESDSQTYGAVAQWRDPKSGDVLRTIPLAARPSISDLASSPVSTALSPQGDILANVGPENVLFWQNVWSGEILQQFPNQNYPLEFSPSGGKFVSQQFGATDKPGLSLVVRDVPQGRVLHELELPQRASRVVWSSDGTLLCAVSFADKKQDVRVWNAESGQLEWQAQSDSANFLRAWFLTDNRLATLDSVSGAMLDGTTLRVRLWPITDGEPTTTKYSYRFNNPDVRWAVLEDGRLLLSTVERVASQKSNQATTEKRVNFLWDVPQMTPPRPLKSDEASLISSARWQGQYYAPPRPAPSTLPTPVVLKLASHIPGRVVVADDSRFWDATTGRLRGDFQPIPPRASALAITPNGKFFASAGANGSGAFLGVWESSTKKLLWHKADSITLNNGGEYSETGSAWTTALAFSPNGSRLLVASALREPPLAFYETHSGKLLWSTQRTSSDVGFDASGAALSDDGELIAVKSSDPKEFFKSQIQLVNAADGKPLDSWEVAAPVYDFSWSHDKTLLALATANGHVVKNEGYSFFDIEEPLVELCEARTGKLQRTLHGAKTEVRSLRFSPDGELLAGAGRDGNIYLWNVASGQLLHVMQGHLGAARDVLWNGNSQLVSVGEDGAARFWNPAQGRLLATALFLQTRAPKPDVYPNTRKEGFGGGQFEKLPPVEWLFYTPDGFYDASPDAEKYLRWRVGTQLVPAAKFKSRFYQPARVRAALNSS